MKTKNLIKDISRIHGYRIYKGFLQKTPYWSPARRDDYVFRHLKTTLIRAYEGTEFYRERFQSIGFDPNADFTSSAELSRLPILTKDQVRENRDLMIDRRFKFGSIEGQTSGTTGEPLRMLLNEYYVAFDTAAIFRQWLPSEAMCRRRKKTHSGVSPDLRIRFFCRPTI